MYDDATNEGLDLPSLLAVFLMGSGTLLHEGVLLMFGRCCCCRCQRANGADLCELSVGAVSKARLV